MSASDRRKASPPKTATSWGSDETREELPWVVLVEIEKDVTLATEADLLDEAAHPDIFTHIGFRFLWEKRGAVASVAGEREDGGKEKKATLHLGDSL